jgi:hypothetical protein
MTTDFAPTDLWPVVWTCDVMTESPTVTGRAVAFATNTLWVLTGRQFGFTTIKLRPCRDCYSMYGYRGNWYGWGGDGFPSYSMLPVGYQFYGGCGLCSGNCSCELLQQFELPAPVNAITEIKIDGVILDPSAYRLDENRYVVRIDGGVWPYTNNYALNDTVSGTWSVTAKYGMNIPDGAAFAIGELACEYIKASNGEDCRLPRTVTQLARQGVTMSFPSATSLFQQGLTGLYLTDAFIMTWNPNHLATRSKTYSVDRIGPRRTG